MIKPDQTVKKETIYIAAWELILSAAMQAVFLLVGRWDITVLLGNLLSAAAAVGNFFLMGLTVQQAVDKEEKEAKSFMAMSQRLRTLMLFIAAVLGAALPCFNIVSALIPLLFPRIAAAFRMSFEKKSPSDEN